MKVDIGCGRNKAPGFVGLDIGAYEGVDIICDVRQGIPLPDKSVDELRAINMLEHLHEVQVLLDEIVRVCKPGAPIFFQVPDVQHERFHMPMHCQPWSRHWWKHHASGYFDVLSIVEIPDPAGLAVARKYIPTITDEDAMLLLWNCRFELHIFCRAR